MEKIIEQLSEQRDQSEQSEQNDKNSFKSSVNKFLINHYSQQDNKNNQPTSGVDSKDVNGALFESELGQMLEATCDVLCGFFGIESCIDHKKCQQLRDDYLLNVPNEEQKDLNNVIAFIDHELLGDYIRNIYALVDAMIYNKIIQTNEPKMSDHDKFIEQLRKQNALPSKSSEEIMQHMFGVNYRKANQQPYFQRSD